MKETLVSWFLLLACNLMWSLQFTCVKLVQNQVGPYFTVWGSVLLATIFLSPFALKEFSASGKSLKDILIFIVLVLLGVFPGQVLITYGTQLSLASNAAILTLSLPVVTAVFAFLILKERMNAIRWVSFIIAIIGVIFCSTGDIKNLNFSSEYVIGNLLIFIAIVGNSIYNTGCKKLLDRYTPVEMVFFSYIFLVIFLTPFVAHYESDIFRRIPSFTLQTWTGMALLTIFHNFLSMILFFKALKKLELIQAALTNYLVTFFGLPIAAIWLGERLNIPAILGGILIFISTLIITIVDFRLNKKSLKKTS